MHTSLDQNRLYVTIDVMILTVRNGRLSLLLSKRTAPPYENQWALPGRFVGLEESAEEAVRKILREMLPVAGCFIEQLYTFTGIDRDPRGRVVAIAYMVILPWGKLQPLLTPDQCPLRCFHLDTKDGKLLIEGEGQESLREEEVAFDHAQIIWTGLTRLRGKIDYTDIGFHFLENPQAFSLGELQNVFQAVLGSALDASNFRRFILNRYEKSGRLRQTQQEGKRSRGRPAALYSISAANPDNQINKEE